MFPPKKVLNKVTCTIMPSAFLCWTVNIAPVNGFFFKNKQSRQSKHKALEYIQTFAESPLGSGEQHRARKRHVLISFPDISSCALLRVLHLACEGCDKLREHIATHRRASSAARGRHQRGSQVQIRGCERRRPGKCVWERGRTRVEGRDKG